MTATKVSEKTISDIIDDLDAQNSLSHCVIPISDTLYYRYRARKNLLETIVTVREIYEISDISDFPEICVSRESFDILCFALFLDSYDGYLAHNKHISLLRFRDTYNDSCYQDELKRYFTIPLERRSEFVGNGLLTMSLDTDTDTVRFDNPHYMSASTDGRYTLVLA